MSMEIVNSLILFVIGFYILIRGAQFLVRGAVSVANIFKVSSWFVGVVVVGIGTSIPELSINLASVFNGNNIGLATIIGSNTFNILVILGLSAIFMPIVIQRDWFAKDFLLNVVAVMVAAIFILFPVLGPADFNGIARAEGIVLFGLFIAWVFFMLSRRHTQEEGESYGAATFLTASIMIVGGIIGVFLGGMWVVDGAQTIATFFDIAPTLVGLTLVAIGTSLPELTVSLVALYKKRLGIAVGNVIGSNIFDFLGILGITALAKPIMVLESVQFDIFAALLATLVLMVVSFTGKRFNITRRDGFVLILLYIAYITFLFM